ncbi:MAG: hypothetical protein WCZ89_09110 [Phycisphaerae bacterium]
MSDNVGLQIEFVHEHIRELKDKLNEIYDLLLTLGAMLVAAGFIYLISSSLKYTASAPIIAAVFHFLAGFRRNRKHRNG